MAKVWFVISFQQMCIFSEDPWLAVTGLWKKNNSMRCFNYQAKKSENQLFQEKSYKPSNKTKTCQTACLESKRSCGRAPLWHSSFKRARCFSPAHSLRFNIVGSLRDREVACSASDRQSSNFQFCVWRVVSSHSSPHPQEVLLALLSLHVHKGGLKPDPFHFIRAPLTLKF